MQGAEGTLYDGEQFQLQFKFGTSYPFESPEVNNYNEYFVFLFNYYISITIIYYLLVGYICGSKYSSSPTRI